MSIVNLENKTILVTGAAGFIGSNLVKRIYQEITSATIIGIDSILYKSDNSCFIPLFPYSVTMIGWFLKKSGNNRRDCRLLSKIGD